MKELAENVGVRACVLSKSHEFAGFLRKPQNRNDLAFANSRCDALPLLARDLVQEHS